MRVISLWRIAWLPGAHWQESVHPVVFAARAASDTIADDRETGTRCRVEKEV